MLPISGFQGTTLIDFPGKISSIIFFAGCNLRCPYCHNGTLLEVDESKIIPKDELLAELDKRKNFIDGVVITGGEPSLCDEVIDFIAEIKSRTNLKIKLDTNGLSPEFIKKALPFVDYVAIDIKTTPEQYQDLGCTMKGSEVEKALKETKEMLENCDKKVEYRTTMYPPVVKSYDILFKMFEFVPRNADYYLQRFMPDHSWSEVAQETDTYSPEQLERMAIELRKNMQTERIFLRVYT